jgi:hypothetical protein
MTSINQLLIDRDSQNFLINYNKNGKESIFQKQGNKYNKLQKKNAQSVKNNILREGYEGLYDFAALENKTKTASNSQSILDANGLSSSDKERLLSLQSQYDKLTKDIDVLEKSIMTTSNNYAESANGNKMANQNIMFTPNKQSAYVTNAGYAKVFKSQDDLLKTGGFNNCPSPKKVNSINTSISGITKGNLISSDPKMLMGTPMIPGQSCGYEGENVYVSSILPSNTTPAFVGCYGTGTSNKPLMKVLGGSGSPGSNTSNIIKNGDFSQPKLASGSYKLYNNNTSIPGWSSKGAGISNGSSNFGFPTPYAGSGQALIIMSTSFVSQIVTLNPGIFSLSFLTVGSKTAGANPISISLSQLATDGNEEKNASIITFTPSVTAWQKYPSGSVSTDFTIKNPGNYVLMIHGNSKNPQQATAIQNLAIVDKSSGSVNQNYSFQDCEQAAIYGGYQYFSLNNVNPETGNGICSVSNVGAVNTNIYPANPLVVTGITPLWSSNTTNTKSVLATLTNSGQLQLLDDKAIAKASFGGGPHNDTGFIGCYNDKGLPDHQRSMTSALNGQGQVIDVTGGSGGYTRQWDYTGCGKAAEANNFQYFGLQWNNGNNSQAQCFLSNDLGRSKQYGKSSNCWKVGDNMVGGGWANAIYSTQEPVDSPYFLVVQDDGNICIYKGTGPGDNQELIWQTRTNGKGAGADPHHVAALGKNGRSYLKPGEVLQMGEFIGNTNGTVYLMMQTDGNLVAYTSQTTSACSKSSANNNNVVASGNNYAINKIPISNAKPANLGKMAYIDNNGILMNYPSKMLSTNSNSFTTIPNTDSKGNDIGSPISGASIAQVQAYAAETPKCVGFVYDKNTQTGYLKSKFSNMNALTVDHAKDIFIMRPSIVSLPPGISPKINEIDSVLYHNYPKGGTMSPKYKNSLSKMTSVQEAQCSQMYDSLNLVASQMDEFIADLKARGISVSNQIAQNNSFINEGAMKLEQLNAKIKKNSMRDLEVYNQILNDNELLATSQNYSYMIWTIIALGVVIVTVNASR